MSRLRPVSGVNYIAPTRLAVGKASLDPLRSVQFSSLFSVHYTLKCSTATRGLSSITLLSVLNSRAFIIPPSGGKVRGNVSGWTLANVDGRWSDV